MTDFFKVSFIREGMRKKKVKEDSCRRITGHMYTGGRDDMGKP